MPAYIWPLTEAETRLVSQRFGDNPSNGNNPAGGHTGTDFAVPEGTPVRAPAAGVIELAGWVDETYLDNPYWLRGGIAVALNCGDEAPSFTFGHLSRTDLEAGQYVAQGQVIGYTGNTGHSFGAHLHFEAIPPGYVLDGPTYGRVDPALYCSGYWTGSSSPAIGPASLGFTPITTESETEVITDDDIRRIVDGITGGVPGAKLNYNYRLGRGEWLGTTVGAFEGRMLNEILPAALAPLSAKLDALTTVAAAGAGIDEAKLKSMLDDSFKATFGTYTLELSKAPTVPATGAQE